MDKHEKHMLEWFIFTYIAKQDILAWFWDQENSSDYKPTDFLRSTE